MEILNIDWNCASTQMASILSICDCTSVYVFLCSFVKSCFNKNVCYYYQYCLICFGALFTAHPVYNALNSLNKHIKGIYLQDVGESKELGAIVDI